MQIQEGIVFTEFMEMLEDQQSMELVDEILESVELASGGAYTSVGTYEAAEMVALVMAAAARTGLTPAKLLLRFGHHLFAFMVQAVQGVSTSITGQPTEEAALAIPVDPGLFSQPWLEVRYDLPGPLPGGAAAILLLLLTLTIIRRRCMK